MKRLLYLLLLCLTAATFTGCGVLRKTQKQDKQEAVQQSESVTGSLLQQIDSSRTSATEITYTKIEYYPPQPGNQQQDPKDETPKDRPAPQPAEAPGENGCPKLTDPVSNPVNAGAVKSIEQITVRTSSESKTEERQSREIEAKRDSVAATIEKQEAQREPDEKAVKASGRWASAVIWIAAVVALFIVGLYLWKAGVFRWIKARLN